MEQIRDRLSNCQRKVFDLLSNAGAQGVRNIDFPMNYGLVYRKRISELRDMGLTIDLVRGLKGVNAYKLINENVDSEGQYHLTECPVNTPERREDCTGRDAG